MFATSSVIYDSVDAALDSAINFDKEASGYVQFLTGADQADLMSGLVQVKNENGFTDLNEYNVVWTLMENNTVKGTGTITDSVAPQTTRTITIPYAQYMPQETKELCLHGPTWS